MNREQLQNIISPYYPAIALDSLVSFSKRRIIGKILDVLLAVTFTSSLVILLCVQLILMYPDFAKFLYLPQNYFNVSIGLFFIIFALWIVSFSLEAFYRSYRFVGLVTILHERGLALSRPSVTFEAASVIYSMLSVSDFTLGFVESQLGNLVMVRSNINRESLNNFFNNASRVATIKDFSLAQGSADKLIGLADVASALIDSDPGFAAFLTSLKVYRKDFANTAGWMERNQSYLRIGERWWGKDSLGRVPGIGKGWAYGGAYRLERFSEDITRNITTRVEAMPERLAEVEELEAVLSRTGESNVLLVGEDGSGVLDIVYSLGRKISDGSVLPPIEHKHLYLFDTNAFIAFCKNKSVFESELLHMLNGAVSAGNAILVIRDLPAFIETARNLGSDAISLLDPFLTSPALQVIAIVSPELFHNQLENDSRILHHFEKIAVKEISSDNIMAELERIALSIESGKGIFFTYQALVVASESINRYIVEGVLQEKAEHLLNEVATMLKGKRKSIVEASDILSLIEMKTGIKTGEVGADEKKKLLNLESVIHERVVGQDEAVKAIAGAMRRARSDIENPQRPMGSFLFLGPTGVGKTETAKALAAVFFGSEESIIRFDMTEYSTDDSLSRLIGSFESDKAGVLASKLREKPYGVLLLDEFEKTHKEVLDLFLQVLDEGFFTDSKGKRVNARNLIIIATSNAGSSTIWNLMREGKDLNASKDLIINEIINNKIFKPELLNRFDGVILFHPLKPEEIRVIAKLMLGKLKNRLAEKGMELVINDTLIDAVAKAGTDPEFGGRPIARAIQEKVEQAVAQKMLKGEARSGSRIELKAEDLV